MYKHLHTPHSTIQIVVYPIIDLRHYKQDLHWYMRSLEEVIIRALAKIGVQGEREEGLTGVWVERSKVAVCMDGRIEGGMNGCTDGCFCIIFMDGSMGRCM